MGIVCARVEESSSFVEEHRWMILCERAAWRLQVGRLLAARVKELETSRKREILLVHRCTYACKVNLGYARC